MRPAPTPEQEELKAAARELCAREVSVDRLLAWESDALGYEPGLRRTIAELGWIGIGAPAAAGGSGADLVDVACLLEECARGLLPRPLIGAIRATSALALAAPEAPELPALVAGDRTLALAVDEPAARDPAHFATRVRGGDGRREVEGEKAYVPDAAAADLHLVAARDESGLALVLVERASPGIAIAPVRAFGNDRQAHVRYAGAPVASRLAPRAGGEAALAALRRQQLALALAEMVGGMSAVLDMTVAYVKEREQFGQKIAIFQAVRHQVADMGTRFTAARHLAWQAICRIARANEQGIEVASAAAYVGQAFKQLCWTAHHLHGGAGFVVEHPLRFHSERAQSLAVRYTPEAPALAEIAAALLD
ncbi:MAG TPA: acyl-CoA dehydrogenase family protein [Candidatus Binatia bacterium]|nr:acyl-CoA dehydrogenase family protein [Candidatus Binatia bacterium]